MVEIAHIFTDFPTKFGLPRQSGLVESLRGTIVFAPEYRSRDALRGLEGYSHLWLIWKFSGVEREGWSATVRPPRLGGNTAMGVFATRSPFRPNPIGLSCVRLLDIVYDTLQGPVLFIGGADLMNGTPIYDIKPYLPFTDCRPDATGGFAESVQDYGLEVVIPDHWLSMIPEDRRDALVGVLKQDPRPGYRRDDARRFGILFAGMDVRFTVREGVLSVCEIVPE
ncbi:MAG: tRNA (N6-threonylcarbamoyladenosine(37)-N6)-methyltransferase TrmO [Christensenellales bacterium]|nr:tRNA (N6-threonylcarbamoyladenosine(37)-N6)-methyltransferase TrmO [Christensenellales bacterium]